MSRTAHLTFSQSPDGRFRLVKPAEASAAACSATDGLYDDLVRFNFKVDWKTEEQCLQMKNRCQTPFVFAEFTGPAFEHLRQLGCKIFGVPAVIHYMTIDVALPKECRTLFCMVMTDALVCFTNLDRADRIVFKNMVEWMGGKEERAMSSECKFLVAEEVGSKKYKAAIQANISILTTEWVLESWKRRHEKRFRAVSDEFTSKFKCPPFLGFSITLSGFGSEQRERLKKTAEENGAKFSGNLIIGQTTHLVLERPEGPKYEAAVRSGNPALHIVSPAWLHHSAQEGYCLPEENYVVANCTLRSLNFSQELQNSSSVDGNLSTRKRRIDSFNLPTAQSPFDRLHGARFHSDSQIMPGPSHMQLSGSLPSVSTNSLESSFFSTATCFAKCAIWLYGFEVSFMKTLERIVDYGGGILADLQTTVTHAVLSDAVDLNSVKQYIGDKDLHKCHILTHSWLIQSVRDGRRQDEASFQHPLAVMLKNPTDPLPAEAESTHGAYGRTIEHIMSQYSVADLDTDDLLYRTEAPITAVRNDERHDDGLETSIPEDMPKCFSGKTFRILGCGASELGQLCMLIQANDGSIVPKKPDYLVVPWLSKLPAAKENPSQLVSPLWIERCCEANTLMPPEQSTFYRSYYAANFERLLSDCVICISQYQKTERALISDLASACGAKVQDHLARKNTKNLLRTTHLILRSPEGQKYEGAIRWKLPCVGVSWLIDSAREGRLLDVSRYAIANQTSIDALTSSASNLPSGTNEAADPWASTEYLNFNQSYVPKINLNAAQSMQADDQPGAGKMFLQELNERLDHLEECSQNSTKHQQSVLCVQSEPPPLLTSSLAEVEKNQRAATSLEEARQAREKLKQQLCSVLDRRPSFERDEPTTSTTDVGKGSAPSVPLGCSEELVFDDMPMEMDTVRAPVDWDDPNQRMAREEIGCLLKEHDQATQASPNSGVQINMLPKHVVQFTQLNDQQKMECMQVFNRLQTICINEKPYHRDTTHLIAGSLNRTGKILAAVANGCWLLHFSYVQACRDAGQLVDEEAYEWSNAIDSDSRDGCRLLAVAGRRWRLRLQKNLPMPAFCGWKVLLVTKQRQKSVLEMLHSGGAEASTDLSFAQPGCMAVLETAGGACTRELWTRLSSTGVRCYKLEYIVGYLLDEPFDEDNYRISEQDFIDIFDL